MSKQNLLKKLNFEKLTTDEIYNIEEWWKIKPSYRLKPGFGVEGDHSCDVVEIYYVENKDIIGLYYNSSLFDSIWSWGCQKDLTRIFKRLQKFLQQQINIYGVDFDIKLQLDQSDYNKWFIIECKLEKESEDERISLRNETLCNNCLEQMKKFVVLLDYFMQKYENAYYKKQQKEFDNED